MIGTDEKPILLLPGYDHSATRETYNAVCLDISGHMLRW
jgi:hypothetical protein